MWTICPECRELTVFEQPPCVDGHGADCPEWCWLTCGFAVIEGEMQGFPSCQHDARAAARSAESGARHLRSA